MNPLALPVGSTAAASTSVARSAKRERLGVLTAVPSLGNSHVSAAVMNDDERRKKILSDPALHEAIRKVIRLRGVPLQDVEDILNAVIADASDDPGLPLNDPEAARHRLCGTARHKSIDDARGRKRTKARVVQPGPEMPEPHPLRPEEQVLARSLAEHGKKRFPLTFSWFERSRVHGESPASIAADAKVSAGYVRHELSNIGRALRAVTAAAAAIFVLVMGVRQWKLYNEPVSVGHGRPEPDPRATALREVAKGECANEQWAACLKDLNKANEIDPANQTRELWELRAKAQQKVSEQDASPGR